MCGDDTGEGWGRLGLGAPGPDVSDRATVQLVDDPSIVAARRARGSAVPLHPPGVYAVRRKVSAVEVAFGGRTPPRGLGKSLSDKGL